MCHTVGICPERALLTGISTYPLIVFYLHFSLCCPILVTRCLTFPFHLSYRPFLLRFHSYIVFWTLPTGNSQSLPPYPTESKSYLNTFQVTILYSLLTIVFRGRYINYNRFVTLIQSLPLYPTENILTTTDKKNAFKSNPRVVSCPDDLPLAWYSRLSHPTQAPLQNVEHRW